MALSGPEETDLLLPLFGEAGQSGRFEEFLTRLQRRLRAVHIALVQRRGAAQAGVVTIAFAGRDLARIAEARHSPSPFDADRAYYEAMRVGRVYAMGEFVDHDPLARAERSSRLDSLGIVDERVVRLLRRDDASAWLVMARGERCGAEDSALLSSLAPYVSLAIETALALDHARMELRLNELGLRSAHKGWLLFDREGRVLASDPVAAQYWADHRGGTPRVGERLLGLTPGVQAMLAETIQRLAGAADGGDQAPQAMTLCEAPRIEALLGRSDKALGESGAIGVLAICTLPRPHSPAAARHLAELRDLPRREAQLALALASGQSIAEAAAALGLTLETARNYSKRLYGKLGVRGQAELVRLVYESAAVLA